jgi:surfactin synthase thioesterase subunit
MIEPTLYIFPHAGGSASFYVPFSKAFSSGIKRIAVQYPGVGNGAGRTTVPSIEELAHTLCGILTRAPGPAGPVAFFGHSMGALVAFEVARRFESAGTPVTALFVSSCAAPGRMRAEYFRDLSDDELVEFLVDLSGTDPRVLDNKGFVDTILPALRGYYHAIAGYACPSGATVSCPIYASVGTHDGLASQENMTGWADHTTAEFTLRVFEGNHFYFADHLIDVANDVQRKIGGRA